MLKTSEYYINYYGQVVDIQDTQKILALFIKGSGSGDNFDGYYGTDNYELYVPNTKDLGRTLVKIGVGQNHYNGHHFYASWILNEIPYKLSGFTLDAIFTRIMKKAVQAEEGTNG